MQPKVHDNSMILLEWDGACFGAVDASFCMRQQKGPRFELYGSNGSIYMGWAGMEMATLGGEWHNVEVPPGEPDMKREWGDVLGRHLADCVAGKATPAFGGEHAVHVVEVMEKILASSQSGEMLPVTSSF
jgi:predicted dehydrogenase